MARTQTYTYNREDLSYSDFKDRINNALFINSFIKHIPFNENFTIVIKSYIESEYNQIALNFIKGTEKTTNYLNYNGNYTLSLNEDSSYLSNIINNNTTKIIFTYSTDNYDENNIYDSDSFAYKVLYARDKTRQNFTPYDWSGQGASDTQALISMIYPVGSIYISTVGIDPAEMWGFGQWTRIYDTFLWAGGDNDVGLGLNKTTAVAGSKKAYLPNHTHTLSSFTTSNNTTATSHSHYPAIRTNTNYKEYNRKYAGWIGVMPDCTSATAAQNLSKSIGQQSYANLSSGNKTMPYVGSNAIDFFWSNETTTVSTVHNHSIPTKDTTTVKTSSTNADIIPNDNRDIATANMPPYLPVYVWKRIS